MIRIRGMRPTTFAKAYWAGQRTVPSPSHVFICVADHFEPDWRNASLSVQRQRIDRWLTQYPKLFESCSDSRGRPPQHTFFYPIECYREEHLESLAGLVRQGYGDVEVHLHHDDDNSESLRQMLLSSIDTLHLQHGLLRRDEEGRIRYGFVHGNWALDNSHPDGRHCGVNDELTVLRQTGCYADFTLPSAPHPAQTTTINSIYYAIDDPLRPKSHDVGIEAKVGHQRPNDGLLMIPGPLTVTHSRPWHRPGIENGNVSNSQLLSPARLNQWLKARVAVAGRPEWQFVKLHTHGAKEPNADVWLDTSARRFHHELSELGSQLGLKYYYVTAFEMAQLVQQAESGLTDPNFEQL